MRKFFALLVIALLVGFGTLWWSDANSFPDPSRETVRLDPEKRRALALLRNEKKFEPHRYPPLGYTGIATPEDRAIAEAAVNDVIGAILLRADGPLSAATVSDLLGKGMRRVRTLETEDRERTAGYMVEIWYLLGFKGATGRFAYGSAYRSPDGYGEPLPPGWKSPTQPRPIRR